MSVMPLLVAATFALGSSPEPPGGAGSKARQPNESHDLSIQSKDDLRRGCKGISHLSVRIELTVDEFSSIADMEEVRNCDLVGWCVSGDLLKAVPSLLPNLNVLTIGMTEGSCAEAFGKLAAAENLDVLTVVSVSNPTDAFYTILSTLEQISVLRVDGQRLSLSNLQTLARMKNIIGLGVTNLANVTGTDLANLDGQAFGEGLTDFELSGLPSLPSDLDWLLPLKDRLKSLALCGTGKWAKGSLGSLKHFMVLSSLALSNVTAESSASLALASFEKASLHMSVVGDTDMGSGDWVSLVDSNAIGSLWIVSCGNITKIVVDEMLTHCSTKAPERLVFSKCGAIDARVAKELTKKWGEDRVQLLAE